MEVKRRDDDLADVALSHRIAGAGTHDFHDQLLIDDHAFAGWGLKRDKAEIGVPNAW